MVLTYKKLNSLANRLASVLVRRGILSGGPVDVALERSVDLVVVLLAVPKAGAACIPNPFHPGRFYRSGDSARLVPPGKLCILERRDHQVRVRGNRVELERQLWDVWPSVLGHGHVSTEDSFFEVGGDSARLVRVNEAWQQLPARYSPQADVGPSPFHFRP